MSARPVEVAAEPVRRLHAADEVFERLAEQILLGELAPGDALPPERELAARFEVSRVIVRSATHRLAEIGLIKVRQGGASVACDPVEATHPTVGLLALKCSPRKRALRLDLYERQLVGGIPLLVLAERRITAAQVDALLAVVAAHERGEVSLRQFEERFWTGVADAGGNSFLRRDARFWFAAVRAEPRNAHPELGSLEQRVAAYRELCRRLLAREGAADAYLRVLEVALEALKPAPAERRAPPPRAAGG